MKEASFPSDPSKDKGSSAATETLTSEPKDSLIMRSARSTRRPSPAFPRLYALSKSTCAITSPSLRSVGHLWRPFWYASGHMGTRGHQTNCQQSYGHERE